MDNNVYIMLSRQLALFRDMDVTANNIANANTTGYNAEHVLFSSFLTKDVNQGVKNPMSFAHDVSSFRRTESGAMYVTGNQLDMAIQGGKTYFMVETPLGTRYTKAGNFQLDGSGMLVTSEGYPVLDNSGQRIAFPENVQDVQVGEAGNVKVNGEDFTTLGLATFENEQVLERLNARLFKSDIAPDPTSTEARVVQGMLESSNVQPMIEMTHMIDISRSVAGTAKYIEMIYDLERKAASTWAKQA